MQKMNSRPKICKTGAPTTEKGERIFTEVSTDLGVNQHTRFNKNPYHKYKFIYSVFSGGIFREDTWEPGDLPLL